MATYICSDPHGEYELFCELLDIIKFSDGDRIFVGGDIIDKGTDSLHLADLIMRMPNAYAIRGNHEYYFLRYLNYCYSENRNVDAGLLLEKLQEYFPEDKMKISLSLVDYLKSMPLYYETKDFILVHAGAEVDDSGKLLPMESTSEQVMLFDRTFKDVGVRPITAKAVCFGHTPTVYANNTGYFIRTPRDGASKASPNIGDYIKIQLDTGVQLTGMLGFLRVDDMEEFYIKKR